MSRLNCAPVVLFVYNRLDHLKKTVEALRANPLSESSDLIIFSDGPKSEFDQSAVNDVRNFARSIAGFKNLKVNESPVNRGLALSIIEGVSKILKEYGEAIIVEDDLVTHPGFLQYMNGGLQKYRNDDRVASIHGFTYPVADLPENYFLRGADCWGWATWSRAWELFESDGRKLLKEIEERKLEREFDYNGSFPYVKMLKDQITGRNSSWAIRWYASAFLRDKLTLYPGLSLVKNIGFDQGTHCKDGQDEPYFGILGDRNIFVLDIDVSHNSDVHKKIGLFFKSQKLSLSKRISNKLKKIVKNIRV